MRFTRVRSILLAVVGGLAALFIALGLLGTTSPVLAQEQESTRLVNSASMVPVWPPDIRVPLAPTTHDWPLVIETDPTLLMVLDLAGDPIGEGEHGGEARCKPNNCNKNTHLILGKVGIEYRFRTLQVRDDEAGRFILAGTGIINNGRQKERFTFTAIVQDNRDGTITVTYVASRPDASFIIPDVPGTIEC